MATNEKPERHEQPLQSPSSQVFEFLFFVLEAGFSIVEVFFIFFEQHDILHFESGAQQDFFSGLLMDVIELCFSQANPVCRVINIKDKIRNEKINIFFNSNIKKLQTLQS